MTNFHDFLNEQLQDPEIRAEYDALEPEFFPVKEIIEDKEDEEWTQKHPTEPFYSDSNISYLEGVMRDVRDGKANFAEYELIDEDK